MTSITTKAFRFMDLPHDLALHCLTFLDVKELVSLYGREKKIKGRSEPEKEGCISKTMCVYAKAAANRLRQHLLHLGDDINFRLDGCSYNDIGYLALFHGRMEGGKMVDGKMVGRERIRENYTRLLDPMAKWCSMNLILNQMIDEDMPSALEEIFASKRISQLTTLSLRDGMYDPQISSAINVIFTKLVTPRPQLTALQLGACGLTDEGARSLAQLKLQKFSLSSCYWVSIESRKAHYTVVHLCGYHPEKIPLEETEKIANEPSRQDTRLAKAECATVDDMVKKIRTVSRERPYILGFSGTDITSAWVIDIARECKDILSNLKLSFIRANNSADFEKFYATSESQRS